MPFTYIRDVMEHVSFTNSMCGKEENAENPWGKCRQCIIAFIVHSVTISYAANYGDWSSFGDGGFHGNGRRFSGFKSVSKRTRRGLKENFLLQFPSTKFPISTSTTPLSHRHETRNYHKRTRKSHHDSVITIRAHFHSAPAFMMPF
jgi:hypothetical protein